jgi:hypothetical protein
MAARLTPKTVAQNQMPDKQSTLYGMGQYAQALIDKEKISRSAVSATAICHCPVPAKA